MGLILGRLAGPLALKAVWAAFFLIAALALYKGIVARGSALADAKWYRAVAEKVKDDRATNFRIDQDTLMKDRELDDREREIARRWRLEGRAAQPKGSAE